MEYRLKSTNERVDVNDFMDSQTKGHDAFLSFLSYAFVGQTGLSRVADGKQAFWGTGLAPTIAAGNPVAGMTCRLAPGVGLRNETTAETDPDLPKFKPMLLAANLDLTIDPAHGSNDRRDRVYAKILMVDEDNVSRDFITPGTGAVAAQLTDSTRRYSVQAAVAKGVEDGSVASPSPPSGYVADDVICEIYVRSGAGTFDNADMNDLRDKLVPNPLDMLASMIGYAANGETEVDGALDTLFDRPSISFSGTPESGYMLVTVPGGTNWALAVLLISDIDDDEAFTLPIAFASATSFTAHVTKFPASGTEIGVTRTDVDEVTIDTNGENNISGGYIWAFGQV